MMQQTNKFKNKNYMKFIEPSVEYWQQEAGLQGVWKQIARATRVCYQSQQRANETDEEFVKRVILKPALITRKVVEPNSNSNGTIYNEYNFDKMHGAMLEHGTVYLAMPMESILPIKANPWAKYVYNKYSKGGIVCEVNNEKRVAITTNLRVLIEQHWLDDLQYLCEPTEYHIKRYTFNVITDIGVTREMNRHRTFSIAEQSTRYCDFNKDKFGGGLTFIKPVWWKDIEISPADITDYKYFCEHCEETYQMLREQGWKPEQARQVLPLGLKTQAVYSAYQQDWLHFLQLRSSEAISGKPHPNMVYIADKIAQTAKEQNLW